MAAIILRHSPDSAVAGVLPENQAEEVNIFALLAAEYEEVPVTPTNEKKNNYTPILYRKNRLELIDCGWHYFAGLNDSGSKTITWACFGLRDLDARFLHFNTHFYWTGDDRGRAARVTNTGELLALMLEVTAKYPLPAVFTGDFNCRSDEPPVETPENSALSRPDTPPRELAPGAPTMPTQNMTPSGSFGKHLPDQDPSGASTIFSRGEVFAKRFVTVVDQRRSTKRPLSAFCDFELGQ